MRRRRSNLSLTAQSSRRQASTRRERARAGRARGVTLIELLIVVAILAVLLASAAPSFVRFVSNHRASTAINDLLHGIALARAEALKRGRHVYIAPVGGHWRDGWVVFVDRNDNRAYDAPGLGPGDELIARHDALPGSIAVANSSGSNLEPFTDSGSPPRPYVMFDGSGYPRQRNGGFHFGGIVITDSTASASTVRTICLSSYGRMRVVVDRAGCS